MKTLFIVILILVTERVFNTKLLLQLFTCPECRIIINHPHVRLVSLKFELTNQDSTGTKRCAILTSMYVNRKGIEVGQLFILETTMNVHELKGILCRIPKTISDCKR